MLLLEQVILFVPVCTYCHNDKAKVTQPVNEIGTIGTFRSSEYEEYVIVGTIITICSNHNIFYYYTGTDCANGTNFIY